MTNEMRNDKIINKLIDSLIPDINQNILIDFKLALFWNNVEK